MSGSKPMVDVIIVGGGAGGVAAALRVVQLGGKVILVEQGEVGGVCVNRGCIPTKFFLGAADLLSQLKQSDNYGIEPKGIDFTLSKLVEKKEALVGEIRKSTEELLKTNGVEIVRGFGRINKNNEVVVDGRRLTGRNILIATGSIPSRPDVKGANAEGVISLQEALDLREKPQRVLILGADPVGLEFASIFSQFGISVTVITKEARMLSDEDHETGQRLILSMRRTGITIELGSEAESIEPNAKGLAVSVVSGKGKKKIEVDRILYPDRRPQVDKLDLPNLGIKTRASSIDVDDQTRTNVRGIYAIGDAAGGKQSHVASAQAIVAAECIMGRESKMDWKAVPHGIYTRPEVASVGLTQREAEEQGLQIVVGKTPYAGNSRAMTLLNTVGTVKVIAGATYGEVLGVHIVGPHATELICEAALAIQAEATVEDLIKTVKLHPSLSEATVEAARDALGMALYVPKR